MTVAARGIRNLPAVFEQPGVKLVQADVSDRSGVCLLYTSDAADERSSVDLGGRRIIKKKKTEEVDSHQTLK